MGPGFRRDDSEDATASAHHSTTAWLITGAAQEVGLAGPRFHDSKMAKT